MSFDLANYMRSQKPLSAKGSSGKKREPLYTVHQTLARGAVTEGTDLAVLVATKLGVEDAANAGRILIAKVNAGKDADTFFRAMELPLTPAVFQVFGESLEAFAKAANAGSESAAKGSKK